MPYVKNKPALKKMKKPVRDNNTPMSAFQFNLVKSLEQEKRVNPKKVFDKYKPPK